MRIESQHFHGHENSARRILNALFRSAIDAAPP
jgi:hypothetical protein